MRGRLAAAAACAAIIASPAQATAIDCAIIKALAQPGAAALGGISARTGRAGLVALHHRGRPSSITGASGCEMSGPPYIFGITCTWSTDNDLTAARREHTRLKSVLAVCLSDPFALQDYKSTVEGLEVLDYLKGSYAVKDGDPVAVSLEVHHYAHIDGSYAVILSISR